MTPILPALDPIPTYSLETALLIAVAVGFLAMLVMNRGDRWFVNLKAQDEPFLVGLGLAMLLVDVAPIIRWIGIGLAAVGIMSRYTDLWDVGLLFGGGG